MELILASQSPRRKELMGLFHLPFSVRVADIDETMDSTKSPRREVARVSRLKAYACRQNKEEIIVAADTIVVCDGKILGKPKDEVEAVEMLTLLSGKTHQVMTGMTVLFGDVCKTCTEVTKIRFRSLSREEIVQYVQSGEPMDKAGAYAIQGGAALFATGITGDYYTIMGLPVCRLHQILMEIAPCYGGIK